MNPSQPGCSSWLWRPGGPLNDTELERWTRSSGEPPSGAGSGEVSDEEVNSAAFTIAEGSSVVSLALALPVTHVANSTYPERDMNGRRGAPHLLELEHERPLAFRS
jgi:hypothetical protein